jgi:hypothetical protein
VFSLRLVNYFHTFGNFYGRAHPYKADAGGQTFGIQTFSRQYSLNFPSPSVRNCGLLRT